jgi:hypothetical protein
VKRNRLILLSVSLGLVVLLVIMLSNRGEQRNTTQVPTPAPATPRLAERATSSPTAPEPATPPLSQAEERKRAVELVQSIYSAPIAFYGRAQDQHGQPVAGAKVQYSALDKFWQPGTKYAGVTDASGYFSIAGIQGAALSVQVSKEGYDRLYNQSDGAFSYGTTYDPQRDRPTPSKDNPAVFVLRKKAPAEPLITVDRDVPVPRDGAPVEVSLKTGKAVGVGQGDLKIECWTSSQAKDAQGRYEWRCRLSVPEGGLVTRKDVEHNFEAPENGYQQSVELHMPPTAQAWRRDHDEQYWVKLRDGTYARMRLRLTTGGGHFASVVSYLNPSGSRNLEYDPAVQASAAR